jgi:hypothetical protein
MHESRRHFLQLLSALPALALAVPGRSSAQSDAAPPPELAHWLEIVKLRWGERLDAAQLREIETNLGWMLRSGTSLRAVALQNSDEPDVVFRAAAPGAAP